MNTQASPRDSAWYRLGTKLPASADALTAMEKAGLANWSIRTVPMFAELEDLDGTMLRLPVPGQYAVVRDRPEDAMPEALGTVGEAYKVVHNEDLAPLLDTLAAETRGTFDAAGAFDNGRRAFVTLRMPEEMSVPLANGGRIDVHLAVMTGHDGNFSTSFMVSPVHVQTRTVLNLAFRDRPHLKRVRHTVGAHRLLVEEAQEALEFTRGYVRAMRQEVMVLQSLPMSPLRFQQFISAKFGVPDDAPVQTVTRTNNKLQQMARLYKDSSTAWEALTTLCCWSDHYAPVRGATATETELRARKAVLDPAFKNRALRLLLEEA